MILPIEDHSEKWFILFRYFGIAFWSQPDITKSFFVMIYFLLFLHSVLPKVFDKAAESLQMHVFLSVVMESGISSPLSA